jgi:hypothetical protein
MTTRNIWAPAFRRLLAEEAGAGASLPAISAAACRLCERFAQQVTPLIGAAGAAAIYARSLHLVRPQFPAFAPVRVSDEGDAMFSRVQAFVEQQGRAEAAEAAVAVLATAGDLLASFIGPGLTARLLREAWPDDFAGDHSQETTS